MLTLHPAPPGHGRKFKRADLPDEPLVDARIDHVKTVERSTTIAEGNAKVHTVEHVLSALVEPDDGTRIEVELTTKEFDLLELLIRQPGVTLKREQIMSQVWDENWWGSTRTLDTHTSTLRRKILDDTDPPSKIVTVRGVGFRFDPTGG